MGRSRGLLVLSFIAAALAVAVAVDIARDGPAQQSDLVLPGFRGADVARLSLLRPGEADVALVRTGDRFSLAQQPEAVVDENAVADLLATLEQLSYGRKVSRDQAEGLDEPRLRLAVRFRDGGAVELALGAGIEELDQVWMARLGSDEAFLVAGYAARALDRRADDLRSRQPIRLDPGQVHGVELRVKDQSLVLGGRPLAVHLAQGGWVRADPVRIQALLAALERLRIRRFAAGAAQGLAPAAPDPGAEPEMRLEVVGGGRRQTLTVLGPCPGSEAMRRVASAVGPGCVDLSDLAAIALFATMGQELYDRRLSRAGAGPPVRIAFLAAGQDRFALERRGATWWFRGGGAAEAEAVHAWQQALDALIRGAWLPPPPEGRSRLVAQLDIAYRQGASDRIALARAARSGYLVRRNEEPVYANVPAAAREIVLCDKIAFRPRRLLGREPAAVRSLTATERGAVVEAIGRGPLLEDWTVVSPPGRRPHRERLAELGEAVARLRATRFVTEARRADHGLAMPRRIVEVAFEPPLAPGTAAAVRHRIRLGAPSRGGCYAQLDQDPAVFELDARRCQLLAGPWSVAPSPK